MVPQGGVEARVLWRHGLEDLTYDAKVSPTFGSRSGSTIDIRIERLSCPWVHIRYRQVRY